MISQPLLVVFLASVATAITPSGFLPSSEKNLTVAYGSVSAVNGENVLQNGKFSRITTLHVPRLIIKSFGFSPYHSSGRRL